MNLNDIHRGIQRNKSRKRIGRGTGSGQGKTAGRGHKGQKSRAGYWASPVFEGGQMPLVRRIPKRGFHNRFALSVAAVNVSQLEIRFQAGEEVNPLTLKERGVVKGQYDVLKILGNGALTKGLKIAAHRFSASAKEKIEKAGGQIVVLPGKAPVVKKKRKLPAAAAAQPEPAEG
jgi:large subunit ribosomal protein L15